MENKDRIFNVGKIYATFKALGDLKGTYELFSQDPVYGETRAKHMGENRDLVNELEPLIKAESELNNIFGRVISPGDKGSSDRRDQGIMRREDEELRSFITDKLVEPDFKDCIRVWREHKLIPETRDQGSPIQIQRLNRRYLTMFENWLIVFFTYLDNK